MTDQNKISIDQIEISPTIFRNYDIRGVADVDPMEPHKNRPIDLTARQAWLIGKAFGTWVQRNLGNKIVVGRDNRRTSVDLATGFIVGALSTGCEVIDIGLSTSPLVYFAVDELKCDSGLVVTGSHNPMWSNGLKLSKKGYGTLVGEEIYSLFEMIKDQDFLSGSGRYQYDTSVRDVYVEAIKSRVKPASKKLKVVVDSGNATGGLLGLRILSELGYDIVPINTDIVYPFPKGAPDPEQPGTLLELGQKVLETGADVGIAYDGDADRVGVVDEKGHKLESDLLVLLLAREVVEQNPGAEIVFDVKCSDLLIEDIKKRGGIPVMWKTGHSNIKQKMADDSAVGIPALLGGELSGHIFFKDRFYGFDDAVYASCRVLEILSHKNTTITRLLEDLPNLKTTRELGLACADDKKTDVIIQLQKSLRKRGYDVNDIDGARVSFGQYKWALVRMSNTQPKLTARFQATDSEGLREIVELVRQELQKYSFIDLEDLNKGLREVVETQ
jgi:phosphomannomutase / phosphoglucomutase